MSYSKNMILNDLNAKVEGRFFKEVTIEDDGDQIIYVFPDTKEFISIIKRKIVKEELRSSQET
ncbi:MAG: hypothetical protein ACFFAQ_01100 [Promethearchaeota archaeon]